MKRDQLSAKDWGERILLALFFAVMGSVIYIILSPLRPLLDRNADYIARIIMILLLLIAVLQLRRNNRLVKYWQIINGFLIMAIVVSLDWIFANYLIDHLGMNGSSPVLSALQKLNEFAVVASVVISLTLMSGGSLGSIYLQKGNLKLGLIIGIITFFIAAAGSIPMANLFNARDLSIARILPWLPWLLVFVLANAAQEELLFRGLFLRKLQPFFGKFMSNFLIAFVFTLMHGSVTYTVNNYIFLAILFPLALAWGYVTQKTDSIWGSILFHAGMDIPILLGIFSNMA
jgi:uncharacterized protein